MAARFGAKIVPFGVVGEDDIAEVIKRENFLFLYQVVFICSTIFHHNLILSGFVSYEQ